MNRFSADLMAVFANGCLGHTESHGNLFLLETVMLHQLARYHGTKCRNHRLGSNLAGYYQIRATRKNGRSLFKHDLCHNLGLAINGAVSYTLNFFAHSGWVETEAGTVAEKRVSSANV